MITVKNKTTKQLLSAWLVLFLIVGHAAIAQQRRPNIVIFLTDDLNQQDIGCYGNKDVITPNMNKLAAEGMRFNKAYAASPMCSPSRSVIVTGLYPFRNGSQMNHFTVRANTPNLPQYLQKLGYRVVISGKTDVFPFHNFPFERIGEEFGRYEPIANRLDRKKETVHLIEEHFKQNTNQPLCLIVAPWVPHVPWFKNKDFDAARLNVPNYLADTQETRLALADYYQSIEEADKMLGEVLAAIDKAGAKNSTAVMLTSDQGAQFPSAKWTVFDQGLRVPFIVRWPAVVKKGAVSNALISLVDVTPTLVDMGGGSAIPGLDGQSFKKVLTGNSQTHHNYVFAETSVEPHFWYNYAPARAVITADGMHYIRNYHPGVRFITHIDKVERNNYYFASWEKKAETDSNTRFLLNRYSYHPPEELYNLQTDADEFNNLANDATYKPQLKKLSALLDNELARQGETAKMIEEGPLPVFFDQSYTINQNKSAADLSFNRKRWNPDTLIITAYLSGIDNGGVVCDYFGNFKLFAYQNQLGLQRPNGVVIASNSGLPTNGELLFKLTAGGSLTVWYAGKPIIAHQLDKDFTKIKGGYVTCGKVQGEELPGKLQTFKGKITDLRFSMNELSKSP